MRPWLNANEQRAWRGLLEMTGHLQARLNRQLQEDSGLSLADYDVLVPLSEASAGRLRLYELAGRLGWEQSRLSHHVVRMQRRGLVERKDCSSDRRGAFVVLTSTGSEAIESAAPGHAEMVRRLVFDGLTPGQVATLAGVARQVLERLAGEDSSPQRAAAVPAGFLRSAPDPARGR